MSRLRIFYTLAFIVASAFLMPLSAQNIEADSVVIDEKIFSRLVDFSREQ